MSCENHAKTEERLNRLEAQVENLVSITNNSQVWQGKVEVKLEHLSKQFDEMDIKFTKMFEELSVKIQCISDKPTKRLDMAINTLITVAVSAAMTFIITQLLK